MAITLKSSQVQQNFGAALEQTLRGEDVIIERYGRPQAAIVSYERYQRLVEARYDQMSGAAHRVAQPERLREGAATYLARDQAPVHAVPVVEAPAYRYVTRVPGICGGQPIVRDTRVPVKAIVGYHKLGMSAEEIVAGLPNLSLAQVHEALSYYYDHMEEIEEDIRENQLDRLIERYGLHVAADGRVTLAS